MAVHIAVFHDSDVGLHSVQVAVLIGNDGSSGAWAAVGLKAETPVDCVIMERIFNSSLGDFVLLSLTWHAERQAL